jgi:hypothetical protein
MSFVKIIFVCTCLVISSAALARAGTLLKCEGISTAQGYKYVGTYCVDYLCTYVSRKIFDEYCPYLIDER